MGLSSTAVSALSAPFPGDNTTEAERIKEKVLGRAKNLGVTLLLPRVPGHRKMPRILLAHGSHGSHASHASHASHSSHTSGTTSQSYSPYYYPTYPSLTSSAIPDFIGKDLVGKRKTPIKFSLPTNVSGFSTIHYLLRRIPIHGTLSIDEDGTITYTPEGNFLGDDSFALAASDGKNTTEDVEFHVVISE